MLAQPGMGPLPALLHGQSWVHRCSKEGEGMGLTQCSALQNIRSGNYPVVASNHTLVLNWNKQTVPLLRQIAINKMERSPGIYQGYACMSALLRMQARVRAPVCSTISHKQAKPLTVMQTAKAPSDSQSPSFSLPLSPFLPLSLLSLCAPLSLPFHLASSLHKHLHTRAQADIHQSIVVLVVCGMKLCVQAPASAAVMQCSALSCFAAGQSL